MIKILALAGAILGGVAVGLGAFGAHGLKAALSDGELQTFETGVRYQMYHALALLAAAWLAGRGAELAGASGLCFVVGILLFSGSLYLLSTKTLLGIEHWRWLGPVTPLGGLSLIIGWVLLAVAGWRMPGPP